MIRAAVLALAAGLAAPAVAQDSIIPPVCEAVLARLIAIAEPVAPLAATVTPSAMEGCLYTDLRLDLPGQYMPDVLMDSLHLSGALQWVADGTTVPDRLSVRVQGLRMVVKLDVPHLDWLFAAQAQAKSNLIRAEMDLAWDAAARVLAVEGLTVDLPGENLVTLSAKVAGVDLGSVGAAQMSLTSFAVTEADLMVQSHGFFETYLLMGLGESLLQSEGDIDAAAEALRQEAKAGIADLPEALVPAESKAALVALVEEMPNPAGRLTVRLRSEAGLGPVRLLGPVMTGMPQGLAEAVPLLQGVTLDIGWSPEDAP